MLTNEQDFLDSITNERDDRATRQVYADWLEKRGDKRAELIRVEEEMRGVPVYADRYWQLKSRRNTLRDSCDTAWLETMRYGADFQPVFDTVPSGWKKRWRLIREFTDRWYGIPLGDVGGRAGEVQRKEAELGLTLPPAMREWIAFAHDLMAVSRFHDVIRDDFQYRIELIDGERAVSLLRLTDVVLYDVVETRKLNVEDPPVAYLCLSEHTGTFSWHRDGDDADPVTVFIFENVKQSLRGAESVFHVRATSRRDTINYLKWSFPSMAKFGTTDIFEKENIIVFVNKFGAVSAHVRRAAPRDAIPQFLWDLARQADARTGVFAESDQG